MTGEVAPQIEVGDKCLVTVAQQRFLVDVLELSTETIHLSFPGIDYPVKGMSVEAEFHDDKGFSTFVLSVLRGPEKEGDGMILEMPSAIRHIIHRSTIRVPTDLGAKVRGPVDVKYQEARVVNLSTGGALIETSVVFALNAQVDLVVELPDGTFQTLKVVIAHIGQAELGVDLEYLYGTRVVEHSPGAGRALTKYIWSRLKELFPPPG